MDGLGFVLVLIFLIVYDVVLGCLVCFLFDVWMVLSSYCVGVVLNVSL